MCPLCCIESIWVNLIWLPLLSTRREANSYCYIYLAFCPLSLWLYKQRLQMQSIDPSCSFGRQTTVWLAFLSPWSRTVVAFHYSCFPWCRVSCSLCFFPPVHRDSGQLFITQEVMCWKGHLFSCWSEKVQLFFAGRGSCITGFLWVLMLLRVCYFPFLPWTRGSNLWLMLFLSSTKISVWVTHWQEINSWLLITLYFLHILLSSEVDCSSLSLSGYC